MTTASSLRLRRLGDRPTEVQKQLISFRLHGTDFLIPIEAAYKAIVFDEPIEPNQLETLELEVEQRMLPIIDSKHLILGEAPTPPGQLSPIHIALIIQNNTGQAVVLPIDSAPSLCRINESNLVSLPKTYKVQCVEKITEATATPPLHFLLDEEQLNASASSQQTR